MEWSIDKPQIYIVIVLDSFIIKTLFSLRDIMIFSSFLVDAVQVFCGTYKAEIFSFHVFLDLKEREAIVLNK